MDARTDFARYPLAVSRALNLIALPMGGLTARPGTRFIKEIKNSANAAFLYGLEPSAGDGYIAEFGGSYIRFIRNQSQMTAATVSSAITNGTFTSNINDWDNRSTGTSTISHSGGKLYLNCTGNGWAWAEQDISIAGADQAKVHLIRFTLSGRPGGTATVKVGTSSTGSQLWDKTGYGIGQHIVEVTPGTGTIYFQVINKLTDDLYLDDVSILSNEAVELTNSPYSTGQVDDLRIAQSNDVFYIFHPSHEPRKLERRGNAAWSLVEAFFEDGPWGEINPEIDLAEANLVKNPTFDGGINEWTAVKSNGAVEFDGSQGVVFFSLFEQADNQRAGIFQNVTTLAPTKLHIMHFQVVG
ncbi:MAG TPA: hypothetical protein VD994_13775, partial [Prosthecobacter sp.]|nr:hypothetical protein [Prosthecobacter sp.]